ncbi:MAG TPA: energy transducer TonB [Candidatus Saccharimonadales bacterium]|nr:energy transducer TonB [Candidatus Saccharimonadales bacterium]
MKTKSKLASLFVLCAVAARAQSAPTPAAQTSPERVQIDGKVLAGKLTRRVHPVYPPLARMTRQSGTVQVHLVIGTDGVPKDFEVVTGPALLQAAAVDAVRQWRYEPVLLNGGPVEAETTVAVVFALANDGPGTRPSPAPLPGEAPAVPIDPQLRADIVRLLETADMKSQIENAAGKLNDSMRAALLESLPSNLDETPIADDYSKQISNSLQTSEFYEAIISDYARRYSDQDIRRLTREYETDGQEKVNAENLEQIARQFALDNIPDILNQMCKAFPDLAGTPNICPDK